MNRLADVKTYNEHLFKNEQLWENYDSEGEIVKKVEVILKKIPEDVQTILDVGCGNGIITNRLGEKYQVTGVDNSSEALAHVVGPTLQASCDNIPVENQSFDLVFSSELLEHLDDALLNRTVEEFRRITKKYIMIAVPNEEQLQRSLVWCQNCQNSFHVYGHIQSYTPSRLAKMLGSEYGLLWSQTLGHKVKYFHKSLLDLRQQTFGQYFPSNEYTICPYCQNRAFDPPKKNIFTKMVNGANKVLAGAAKDYWLLTLFRKN